MGAGPAGVRAVVVCAVLGWMLGIGVPAGAGTDDTASAGERGGPERGVTYSGRVEGLRAKLTAIGPNVDGEMMLLVGLRLECGGVRGQSAVDEQRTITVGTGGSYSVDVKTSEVGGGSREVEIHLNGRFEDEDATTARFSYDLFDEDDDGNTDACKEQGDLELEGGRPSRGLQRVEVAIPLEPDDSSYRRVSIAPTSDAVFLAFGDASSADSTEVFRIDPSTNEVVAHNTVPVGMDTLVAVGSSLFGIDSYLGTLIPVDPASLTPGTPIQIARPTQGTDDESALAPDGATVDGSLWLAATRDRELVRVDPSTGAVVGRVPLDAYPSRIMASSTGLYVVTQTSPTLSSGTLPQTNVIRRIDPASGQVLATSPAYVDGSVGASQTSDEGVVLAVTSARGDDPDELVALDPETLETRATATLQYPLAAAAPGYWTDRAATLRALRADLTRAFNVPYVLSEFGPVEPGFDAIWVYNEDRQLVYRISTT